MSAQPVSRLSPEEYLAIERKADLKSEYYDGRMYAMAGTSPVHALIITNLARELSGTLKQRRCFVYTNDVRLRVSATGLCTYPDAMVVCGDLTFADDHKDTILNPVVVIEVLSDSTESYDRGRKFAHYRALESLEEYVLVWQREPRVERFRRQSGGEWLLTESRGLEAKLPLESLGCRVALAEIYDKVEFAAERLHDSIPPA